MSPDDTYSNPVELRKGLKQKMATLERDKKGGSDSQRSSRVSIPVDDMGQESEYAVPADHIKKGSIKRGVKSPSMSPPPPPLSPPTPNGLPDEMYATVERSTKKPPPPVGKKPSLKKKGGGYDHLDCAERGYDHLAPSPEAVRRMGGQRQVREEQRRSSVEAPPRPEIDDTQMYATVPSKQFRHRRGNSADNLSSTASPPVARASEGRPKHHSPPAYRPTPPYQRRQTSPPPSDVSEGLYSVVDRRKKPSAYNPRPESPPSYNVSDSLYSVVDKTKKKPPPTAPRPSRASRSPTPKGK